MNLRLRVPSSVLCGMALVGLATCAIACTSDDPGSEAPSSGGSSSTSGSGGSASGSSGTGSGGTGMGGTTGGAGGATGGAGAGSGGTSGGGGSGGATGGSGGTGFAGDRSPESTCARWKADTADMSEGTWSGSLAQCEPGDISAEGRANALRLFNLYRWLADLPAVETTPERNTQAQACALMMDAANDLSHDPGEDWPCYSEVGATGAATSNISGGPGVMSVLLYMVDDGNETTFGHRRIILSNGLGPIGLGSTGENGASCMQNIGGTGDAGKEWTAWPPPGPFPILAYGNDWASLSDTGWSIQSEDIDLEDATVTITSGGTNMPVDVSPLNGNYGNNNAIRIVPDGWDAEVGATYSVTVSGIDTAIAYDVSIVDCE